MNTLACAHATSLAPPESRFGRLVNHATWSQWSPDNEWARLDGAVAVGASGVFGPRRGPKTRFVISALVPDREYIDTSRLPGAHLVFSHREDSVDDRASLLAQVRLFGPLARVWARVLGRGIRDPVPVDPGRLVALVEAEQ